MSQFTPSQDSLTTPSPRTRSSRHKAVGPYGELAKTERIHSNRAYHQFMRRKRLELRTQDPTLSSKDVSKAARRAWTEASPAEPKLPPALAEFPPSSIPAKPSSSLPSDIEEAETGQSDFNPTEPKSSLLTRLGGALRQVAGYFLVRPF